MHYEVVHENDIEEALVEEYYSENLDTVADPSRNEGFRNLRFLPVDDALDAERVQLKLWFFEPGDEIIYHAHLEQEEVFYILEGEFSLKLGPSGEEEYVEAGPGTFYIASPRMGHGHRYIGDDEGVVLAIGAPPGFDPGRNPHEL